ncbi:MAG: hypothetical protein EBR82_50770 [Caulobacteraceae bacterium]|nr:hypothetical protein [Caulobacteraceae bacterium]
MANTSGASSFNLDLAELVEEAFERAGSELRTGYNLRTARRSLNIMFADWANRGINMWSIEPGTITLQQGQNTYPLPNDTIDLLEHVIRTGGNLASTQADLTISRISVSTYATIPNKIQQARPIQVWIQRYNGQNSPTGLTLNGTINSTVTSITLNSTVGLPASGFVKIDNEIINYSYIDGNVLSNCFRAQQNTTAASHTTGTAVYWAQVPAITVWPTPDAATTYVFAYWRLRRTQDAGGGVNIMDVPFRFIPCLAAGLAYYIAMKIPEGATRLVMLKQQYDEAWELAASEDREKAALRLVPRQQFIGSTI